MKTKRSSARRGWGSCCSAARSRATARRAPRPPDERKAAAQKWREWFEAIRPLDLDDHDEGTPQQPPASSSCPSAAPRSTFAMTRVAEHRRRRPTRLPPKSPSSKSRCWASRNTTRSRRMLMAVLLRGDPGGRLAGARLCIDPGVCGAGQRAACRSSTCSAGAAAAPTGPPARPRRSTSPAPTRPRWRRTTKRRPAISKSPRSQQTPGAMLDVAVEAGQSLAEVDLGAVMPSGGQVASGKRASKLGHRRAGPGLRPGRRRRARRTALEHHLQAGPAGRGIRPAARCAGGRDGRDRAPRTSFSTSRISRARRRPSGRLPGAATTACISSGRVGAERNRTSRFSRRRASTVGESVVFQFYPQAAERRLAELEVRYKGRQPAEIRVTRFTVVPSGNGYDFQVVAQEALR